MAAKIDRRNFMYSTAAIGAGLFVAPNVMGATESPGKKDDINVAILGLGSQGTVLYNAINKLGMKDCGIKFRAFCDIWEDYRLLPQSRRLRSYERWGHKGTPYTDYKEMLATEKDLDAVIVATPDFWHSEHTVACLEAGLHVYCEKEMSNTLEGARKMVEAAKKSGKLLQIGHQRRSNPKYRFVNDNIINKSFGGKKLLGRITTINGQWNRSRAACIDLVAPKGKEIPVAVLNKYGFKDMKQFMNWRWYKGLGGGPIVDLGSHQIDIYSWFLGNAKPKSVMASGGVDYWTDHQWYDNVMATYEFDTPEGVVRASYQTLTTSGSGGYFEKFMGDRGTLDISEDSRYFKVGREKDIHDDDWQPWVDAGLISKLPKPKEDPAGGIVDVRSSPPLLPYKLNAVMNKPFHQPHLVNFFDSIRGKATLNCPAEIGYETAVMVLKVNEAVAAEKKLTFSSEEFEV